MGYSARESISILEDIRKSGEIQSKKVHEAGSNLVKTHSFSNSNEACIIFEQVAIASMEVGDLDTANLCIEKLVAEFPDSLRINRLECMLCEAKGDYSAALEGYENILALDPANLLVYKRKIAILIAQKKYTAAIKALVSHLDNFPSDTESWIKLSQLYSSENM
ncbi:ER membrane protein complex subunit 2 [Smittium culicis]|uniref:ER membrane protein complex subunit 2 n=1 Tax=Smittium culicis TaxID=133412 RepID=A0A1R1YI29_9FUNG|nr:ER membrane protein complex subunit 2 [Smittium culicis]